MRLYLAQMCEKFTDTFKKMKELRVMRMALEEENEQILEILIQESHRLETTITKLKDDITKIQEKRDELMRKSTETQKEMLGLSKEKSQKQEKLKMVITEFEKLKMGKKGSVEEIMRNLENEIIASKDKLEENKKVFQSLNEKEIELKSQLETLMEIMEKKEESLNELEESLKEIEKNSLEKSVEDHEIIGNYRKNLRENREKIELIEKKEKELDDFSEELESKMERLKTIIVNNKALKSKMLKNEDNLYVYQLINKENQTLKEEVLNFRMRIQALEPINNNELSQRSKKEAKHSNCLKILDMTVQSEKNKALREKIEKLQKDLEKKETEFGEIKIKNGVLKEKKEDLKKNCLNEEEKNRKLVEYYEKLSETLDNMREKMQILL